MSQSDDQESKTEQPTEKALADALEQGNVPISRDVVALAAIVALLSVVFVFKGALASLHGLAALLLEQTGDLRIATGADLTRLSVAVAMSAGTAIAAIVAILAFGGVVGTAIQTRPRLVGRRIRPDLQRISFVGGVERIFSRRGLADFARACGKLVAGLAVVLAGLGYLERDLRDASFRSPSTYGDIILSGASRLVGVVAVVAAIAALVDVFVVRFGWLKNLRMTRQQVKDEMRHAEGDPLVKGRLRALAQSRSRRRMIDNVGKATVVIVNPTHIAIALRYVREEGGAPLVLAKGKDGVAQKIRDRATAHGIPVVENAPLARAMYDQVQIERMIPPEFYRAVAAIINLLMRADQARASLGR